MKAASIPVEEQEPAEEWIKKHEKNDSPVEQALIKFTKNRLPIRPLRIWFRPNS
jgi:hypothetical protein